MLDDLCAVIMPPLVRSVDIVQQADTVAGVPGIWYRPRHGGSRATMLYLHGGGYVGTSPRMYGLFVSWLCRRTGCQIFVADIRLAPEFPFPADLEDAVLVLEALLAGGVDPSHLFVAGDSSGGGLVSSLIYSMVATHHRPIAGVVLFSPELDLVLDEPSITENADRDILPWNIPTSPYLHGREPDAGSVSAVDQDVSGWPPTFVSYRGRRDVPRLHSPVRGPPGRGRRGRGRLRGTRDVPCVPHPHAVGGGEPAGLPGRG